MNIRIKYPLFLILYCTSSASLAGSEDIVRDVNFYADVYHYLSGKNLTVNMAKTDTVNAVNNQNCQLNNNSSCQNFSGVSGVQTSVNTNNNTHKVVVAVIGSSSVNSYAKQNGTLNDKKAQNCAATSCIQIME